MARDPHRRRVVGADLPLADRLLETTWGVLVVLSVTGSADVGAGLAGTQLLIIGLVTAFAWAVIEGVMDLIRRRLEKVTQARVLAAVAHASHAGEHELEDAMRNTPYQFLLPEDQALIRLSMLDAIKRAPVPAPRLTREDLRSAFATGLALWSATLPVLLPFWLILDSRMALLVSQVLAVAILGAVGAAWGRYSEQNPLRTGAVVAAVGFALAALLQALHA